MMVETVALAAALILGVWGALEAKKARANRPALAWILIILAGAVILVTALFLMIIVFLSLPRF